MNKIKCECGHINPEGTVLCEACGKPIEGNQHIDGNDQQKVLNMRYEGSARRSKTYNRNIIDQIWNFFSSVKVGIWLIVIALIASGLGTIFPQEMYIPIDAPSRDPAIYYETQFGLLGKIYYQLGFHNMYTSWWYMIIIALIGVSLVICSIDRFVPLYRALKMQRAKRHETFIRRQRFFSETKQIDEQDLKLIIDKLKAKRYYVHEEDGHILAEKGRFSRWGPYVNHIGLIIILIGAMLRIQTPLYLDEYVWVREGETTVIPGTNNEYFIENKKFTVETYDPENPDDERYKDTLEKLESEIVKNYQTDVVIYQAKDGQMKSEEDLIVIEEAEIQMNRPLKFAGYALYQSGYQLNEFSSMTFKLYEIEDEKEEEIVSFTVDLRDPEDEYTFDNGFKIKLEQYFPDYVLDERGPRSETQYPRNPAFVFRVYPPDSEQSEISFIGIGKNIDATGENEYKFGIIDFDTHHVSGLTVRRDYTLPIFFIGAMIFLIGVIQGMYWQHRRIWLHPTEKGLLLAGHTNKNWYGFKNEIEIIIDQTSIKMVIDQQEGE